MSDTKTSRIDSILGVKEREALKNASVCIVGSMGITPFTVTQLCLLGLGKLFVLEDDLSADVANFFSRKKDVTAAQNLLEISKQVESNTQVKVVTDVIQCDHVDVFICNNLNRGDSLQISRIAKATNAVFICCENFGLLGYVFADNCGRDFEDARGCDVHPQRIVSIDNGLVSLADGFLSEGDFLEFYRTDDENSDDLPSGKIEVQNCRGSRSFQLPDEVIPTKTYRGGAFVRTYFPTYKSKHRDYEKWTCRPFNRRNETNWIAIKILNEFKESFQRIPKPRCNEDVSLLLRWASRYTNDQACLDQLSHIFAASGGTLAPIQNILGSVITTEVLKSISRKFRPLDGCRFFSFMEQLYDPELTAKDCYFPKHEMAQQIAIIGIHAQEKLERAQMVMGGMGAVGCSFTMLSAMTGLFRNGSLSVIDYDHVSEANLIGQLLFLSEHSKNRVSKVHAAFSRLQTLGYMKNNWLKPIVGKIEPVTDKHHSEIYSTADWFISAVDHRGCREHIEKLGYLNTVTSGNTCGMIEGGISGDSGSSVVSIPFCSRSYVDRLKQEEDEDRAACIPKECLATTKDCIRCAVEQFEYFFSKGIERLLLSQTEQESTLSLELKSLYGELCDVDPKHEHFSCLYQWGVKIFNILFHDNIVKALEFRREALDNMEDNTEEERVIIREFLKMEPSPIRFDPSNAVHSWFRSAVVGVILENSWSSTSVLVPKPFDKDTQSHLELVFVMSKLYASVFHIHFDGDIERVRRVAGNIIPSILTTTAMVSSSMVMNAMVVAMGNYDRLRELGTNSNCNNYHFQSKLPAPIHLKGIEGCQRYCVVPVFPNTCFGELIKLLEGESYLNMPISDDEFSFQLFDGPSVIVPSLRKSRNHSLLELVKRSRYYTQTMTAVILTLKWFDWEKEVDVRCFVILKFRELLSKPSPLQSSQVVQVPRGLKNIRGSCYFNTALQLLECCSDWYNDRSLDISDCSTLMRWLRRENGISSTDVFLHLEKLWNQDLSGSKDTKLILVRMESKHNELFKPLFTTTSEYYKCSQCGKEFFQEFSMLINYFDCNKYPECTTLQELINERAREVRRQCCNGRNQCVRSIRPQKYYFFGIDSWTSKMETPMEILLPDANQRAAAFKLCGFAVFHPGHYSAVVRRQNHFFHCNDSRVTPIKSKELRWLLAKACIFVFERIDN